MYYVACPGQAPARAQEQQRRGCDHGTQAPAEGLWSLLDSESMGVSENRGTLSGGPFKGILVYLGYNRGTPILGNTHVVWTYEKPSSLSIRHRC